MEICETEDERKCDQTQILKEDLKSKIKGMPG